jgi:hypothetical protein
VFKIFVGSELTFVDRGEYEPTGVPGARHLYALDRRRCAAETDAGTVGTASSGRHAPYGSP